MKLTPLQRAVVTSIRISERKDFSTLVSIAGLDPRSDFKNANLSGVNFDGADLAGFDFAGADLSGADFRGAKVSGAIFSDADILETKWPERSPGGILQSGELDNIQGYLRRLFKNDKVRLRRRLDKNDSAECYLGEEFVGVLFIDDEDSERSYNFQMAILDSDINRVQSVDEQRLGGESERGRRPGRFDGAIELRKVEAYLRRLFSNARIRVVARPKKEDSAEIYIGDEFIGVLFVDDEDVERSYNFQMAILGADLET